MLSRKWRLVVFAMAFLSVQSHPCAAGPIKRPTFTICIPEPFSLRGFPRSAFLPSPTTMFHLLRVDLTHITAPPEFQAPRQKSCKLHVGFRHLHRVGSPPGYLIPFDMQN